MSVPLDAYGLIALLPDEPAAQEVETILRRGDAAITAVNLAEALGVVQRIEKIHGGRLAELTMPLVGDRMTLIPITEQIARDAAAIRARRYHRTRVPISLAERILLAATGPGDQLAAQRDP